MLNVSWKMLAFLPSLLLFLAGWTGLADAFVEWRDSFEPMVQYYLGFRNSLAEALPFSIAKWLLDYIVIGSGVTLSIRISHLFGAPLNRFDGVLEGLIWPIFLFFHICLLWSGFTTARRTGLGDDQLITIHGVEQFNKAIVYVFGSAVCLSPLNLGHY